MTFMRFLRADVDGRPEGTGELRGYARARVAETNRSTIHHMLLLLERVVGCRTATVSSRLRGSVFVRHSSAMNGPQSDTFD
jgi:hypothetical protein